jgi:hypothetical protein
LATEEIGARKANNVASTNCKLATEIDARKVSGAAILGVTLIQNQAMDSSYLQPITCVQKNKNYPFK